jgi:hypothetical protein
MIEERLHWVRAVDFDEGRSQIRTGHGPRIMARPIRNLAITNLRLAGATSIAAALRHHARRPDRPPQTIMNCRTTLPGPARASRPEAVAKGFQFRRRGLARIRGGRPKQIRR